LVEAKLSLTQHVFVSEFFNGLMYFRMIRKDTHKNTITAGALVASTKRVELIKNSPDESKTTFYFANSITY
jgi:hypothetical protein